MNVLILGGTQFVGRHIVDCLLAAGHTVTIFNRGKTPDQLPEGVERLRGDRDAGTAGLAALNSRCWDACIDVSGFTPRQVRPSAELLLPRIHRYVFISAVAVYGDPNERPVLENCCRVTPAPEDVTELTSETYGRAKVACEDIVQSAYADRCAILRPQIVAGPHDPFDRYSYWVRRATQGGEMLLPGSGYDHLQVIDARDLACFTMRVIEHNLFGVFNLSGPRLTWLEFAEVLGVKNPVWVPADIIKTAGITEFELPLFRAEYGPRSALMDVNSDRAQAAGLKLTSPHVTAHVIREWLRHLARSPALSPEREAELIGLARPNTRRGNSPSSPATPV